MEEYEGFEWVKREAYLGMGRKRVRNEAENKDLGGGTITIEYSW